MTAFLCIRDLHQRYGGRAILERISLDVIEGDFVAVVGASGCGKSTFLRLLLAEEQPTAGSISLDGKPPAREPGRDRGVVFQRYSVFPHMTVLGNLIAAQGLGANILGALFGRAHADAGARARAMLERIGLAHMARAYPAALSGGMQQRLAIA
ncbi:MAG: ATP-binding cassette domain-containing protein, partial [Pseudomonadota bacterium]